MDATYSSAIKLPNLQAYLARLAKELGIEVEQRGHRRWVFRESIEGTRYHRAVARVRIKMVGDANVLKWHPTTCAPTEEEAEAIAAELAGFKFPKSIGGSRFEAEAFVANLPKSEGQLFHYFYDSSREAVIMILERWYKDPAKRRYTTYTLFDEDGQRVWRRDEEPDGELPFWKPHRFRDKDHKIVSRNRASVMVHESAKTAEWLDGLINDPERRDELELHPWAEELSWYEHWGMVGAERPAEMDHGELRQAEIVGDLVYVCDNDAPGEEALETFSRIWGKRMLCVRFGDDFPQGHDAADPIPEKALDKQFADLIEPATWATRLVSKRTNKQAAVYELTDDFAREWVHVRVPEVYAHRRLPKVIHTEKQFDHHVAPFAHHRVKVSELLNRRVYGRVDSVKYDPSRSSGIHHTGDGSIFNIYMAPRYDGTGRPDVAIIDEYFERVYPIREERLEVMRWSATLIVHPETKMSYGLLLISDQQRMGKNTLGEMLAEGIGRWNASTAITEREIMNPNYTYWAENRLVVISEIYAGHSSAAYNFLKEFITNKTVRIFKKYLAPYDINNWVHIIACSNSIIALRLDCQRHFESDPGLPISAL